jgi:hypothetical protein
MTSATNRLEIRYTKESITNVERATLLVLHSFCIRLQDEDFTFIRGFIQRHVSLIANYRKPYHLQDLSPSDSNHVGSHLPIATPSFIPFFMLGNILH